MDAKQPAPVYLSKNVTRIGIINRSIPDKKYEAFDVIDKILTAEGKELDKKGSITAIENLKSELEKTARMNKVMLIDSVDFKKYGIDQFSAELSWDKINEICQKNQLDAIYELSYFDTDSKINYRTISSQVNNNLGIKIPIIAVSWGFNSHSVLEKLNPEGLIDNPNDLLPNIEMIWA